MTQVGCEDDGDGVSLSSSHYCWFLATEGPRRADRENPTRPFPSLSIDLKREKKKENQSCIKI